MLDYESLKLIWWLLIGVLLIGFAVTDGFDMGAVSLLKLVGKTDAERRVILNTVGPHWDGNQVWFITAGGAIFAAWPVVYATAFSGLYWALLLVLFALFFRPVGFEYRSKIDTVKWRGNWDWLMTAGSAVPALVFGVAFGNLFLGLPFAIDETMRSEYQGSFWQLLSPFALVCGLVSLLMLVMHGGVFLQLRTEGALSQRAGRYAAIAAGLVMLLFAVAGLWLTQLSGYQLSVPLDGGAVLTPLDKQVALVEGGWLSNYAKQPLLMAAPAVAYAGLLMVILCCKVGRPGLAFIGSSLTLAAIIFTAGASLFPFVMPSSLDPNHSLTLWDVVSSEKTLGIMFWVAVLFVPVVLSYTAWGYFKMRGKVTSRHIEENNVSAY